MLIVKTLDNKMLQDTVAGVILHPRRPTLTEMTSFLEGRISKNEYRPAEVEVLVKDFEPAEGVTDQTLADDFDAYVAEQSVDDKGKKIKNPKIDFEEFLDSWVKENGTSGKKTKKADEGNARTPNAASNGRQAGQGNVTPQ